MTLWDLMILWIKRRIARRRERHPWMAQWPQWQQPQRFNPFQKWAMRRGVTVFLLLVLFKVNPFHPLPMLLTLFGGTLMWVEHKTHQRQQWALFGKPKGKAK